MLKCFYETFAMATSQNIEEDNVFFLGTVLRLGALLKQSVYLCLRKIYYCFVGKSHFATLPPEMAEIPIKMAINTAMSWQRK